MATPPSETTAVAGTILTAATWNANVRDAINFLIARPLFVGRQASAQSVPTGVWTTILLDTEDIDRDNGHSTTSNTSRYTCQTAGWYHGDMTLIWSNANTTGIRALAVTINGQRSRNCQLNATAGFHGAGTSGKFYLNVSDYVEMSGYQSSPGALNTNAAAGSEGYPFVELMWIST